MIKAVIFDFDGTLMNTLPGIAYFGNTALESVGLEPVETDKFRYFVGDGRNLLIHRMLAFRNADTPENYEAAGAKYDEEYEKNYLFKSEIYDGIPELLEKLRRDGIKTAVLSNKPDNVATQIIDAVFKGKFDIYHGQRPGIPTKPSPDAALEIASELGAAPEECVFVGDTIIDVTTGKNAGMHTIGVTWGFREKSELEDADSIAEIPSDIYEAIKNLK